MGDITVRIRGKVVFRKSSGLFQDFILLGPYIVLTVGRMSASIVEQES